MAQASVKIDKELKEKVERLIGSDDLRLTYPTLKHFVDNAVLRFLKEIEQEQATTRTERKPETNGPDKKKEGQK